MFMNHWFMIMIIRVVQFVFKFYRSVHQRIISRECPPWHVPISCAQPRHVSIKCLLNGHVSRSYAYQRHISNQVPIHDTYQINQQAHLQEWLATNEVIPCGFRVLHPVSPDHLNYPLVVTNITCTYPQQRINHRQYHPHSVHRHQHDPNFIRLCLFHRVIDSR